MSEPWLTKKEFVPFVQPVPSLFYERTIIYATRYQSDNEQQSGIFEFDPITSTHSTLKLWTSLDCNNYFPRWHIMVYSPIRETVIIVGGGNVKNDLKLYDQIVFYKMNNKSIIYGYTKQIEKEYKYTIKIPSKISLIILQYYRNSKCTKWTQTELKIEDDNKFTVGANGKLLLTHNDNYLHIMGGTTNDYHLLYDLNTHKIIKIHSFKTQIAESGMFYVSKKNCIVVFGGFCYANRVRDNQRFFDDFWCFDLNPKLALLSMDLLPTYTIHGFVREILNECKYEIAARFDIAINDIIMKYIDDDMNYTQWTMINQYKIPIQTHGFGSLLYNDRVIFLFGGKIEGNLDMEDIYYLDLQTMDGWRKCDNIKMPKPGSCNAIQYDDQWIHILPYSSFTDHFVINIRDLLPDNLIKYV